MLKARCVVPWLAVAVMLGILSGCGGGDQNPVSGKVTLDGEPLPDALVMFTPISGGRPAAGRTDAQGNYELIFSREGEGAQLGEHLVTITTGDALGMEDGTEKIIPEKVPAKYNAESDVRVTIESGENVFNWELESEGEIIDAAELEGRGEDTGGAPTE